MSLPIVFVTGATGIQGGAVARSLLRSKNWGVRALVRDPTTAAAQTLAAQGATLIKGDWDDLPAIDEAASGCSGLFLNTFPSFTDQRDEFRRAEGILKAARAAGVKQVVYSRYIPHKIVAFCPMLIL